LPMVASDGRENVTGRSWRPFETQLHRERVACERRLDGSARPP
jgi:hypothetical protein